MLTIREYKKAESLEEAWQLNQKKPNRVLGGMLWMRMSRGNVNTAIDLSGLGLNTIEETEAEFKIGAMVTLRQLELHAGFTAYSSGANKDALRNIVGVQFRNLATVGGSVFGRFGFSDVITLLLAMDSYVELYKGGVIPLADFVKMKYDRDILVRIIVKKVQARYAYQSVRITKTDFPVLTCAAALSEEGRVQVAVGARPAKAALVRDEQALVTLPVTQEAAQAFAAYAAGLLPTETNPRGSASYRTHLIKVLVKRCLLQLGGEA